MNTIMTKAEALGNCLYFSGQGADTRSRRLLLNIGILAHIWPAKKAWLLRYIQSSILKATEDTGKLVKVSLRPWHGSRTKTAHPIWLRVGNRADYQSLWECLNDVYSAPPRSIDHVLDGGANLGFFTVALTQKHAVKDIILVEPDPSNLSLLCRNVAALKGCQIVEAALSGQEGTAEFLLAESNTGRLQNAPGHADSAQSISVPCRRLSDVMPPSWDMTHTWLKLDIEGAEYDVLRDMLRGNLRPYAISAEIHEYPSAGGAELVRELETAGYLVSMMDPGDERNVCRQISAVYTGYENA